MPYYTERQIEQARSVDLLTYLQKYEPTELVHLRGNIYCTREHDSLKISNGKWYWWSRGFGGRSALDYLIKVNGMSFTDAMKLLTEGASAPSFYTKMESDSRIAENKRLLMPEKSETNDHIFRYLTGRGIDEDIIRTCIHRGVLYESELYHNCVFLGYDEKGIARYGCYRSTNDIGSKPNPSDDIRKACEELDIPCYVVGDALAAPRLALDAIHEAYKAVLTI